MHGMLFIMNQPAMLFLQCRLKTRLELIQSKSKEVAKQTNLKQIE